MKSKLFCFVTIALVMSTMGVQKLDKQQEKILDQKFEEYLAQQAAFNTEMRRYKITPSDEAKAFTNWEAARHHPNNPGYSYELQELVREKVKAIMAKKKEKEAAKKAEAKKQKDAMLKQLLKESRAKKIAERNRLDALEHEIIKLNMEQVRAQLLGEKVKAKKNITGDVKESKTDHLVNVIDV